MVTCYRVSRFRILLYQFHRRRSCYYVVVYVFTEGEEIEEGNFMKVRLLDWRGMFVTGVQRYVAGLRAGLDAIGADYKYEERTYREKRIFGRVFGGYLSLFLQQRRGRDDRPDTVTHAIAPAPFQKCDVVTVHDLTPFKELWRYQNDLHTGLGQLLTLQTILGAKKVITPTQHVRQDVIRMCGKRPKDVYPIFHAVDTDLFRPLGLKREENTILYVGDDNGRKNIVNLVAACATVGARLVWIGPCHYSRIREEVLTTADNLHVDLLELKNISDEKLIEWYNRCTVHAYPSFDEGFGLPLLEAAACGTVSVCSEIPPFREILRDFGVYVNPASVASIAKGLTDGKRLTLMEKRATFKRARREWALRFTWQKTAEKTLAVYQDVEK